MKRVAGLVGALGLTLVPVCSGADAAAELAVPIRSGDTIAFLGDSITAAGIYCRLVTHGLKMQGVHPELVVSGVPGNTSKMMLERLDAVLATYPKLLVLAAGVNDIWHGDPTVKIGVFQPSPGMGVNLEDYKTYVTGIVDRATAAGARVMLTTITPIREDPSFKLNVQAREYNAFLHALARERGLPLAPLHEVMFAEIASGRRLTGDGVHPGFDGHAIMAREILRTLGLDDEALAAAEREWREAPVVLILGDKQTTSGFRTGGWALMVRDGLNSGREMVEIASVADYRNPVTVAHLLGQFRSRGKDRLRHVILQAPRGDVESGTPLPDYRRQVGELIDLLREQGLQPVLATLPVPDNHPAGEFGRKIEPYNAVLRELAREKEVPLADIHQRMVQEHAADPEVRLTFDGERFNHDGAMLMAETLMHAMGAEALVTPELLTKWRNAGFYAGRSGRRTE